jgi:HD-GYP domain-containing protein (c-di-GMP phosphodiesterase class II)
MGFDQATVDYFKKIALLHDIGKLGVKDSILHKQGKVSDEEWEIIKQHPVVGEEILKPILGDDAMLTVVRGHHERQDGRGYPDRLTSDKINIFTAIVGVADAYDAMTSTRAYRAAFTKSHAIEELKKHRGTQFHPKVVDVFLEILAEDDKKT